MITDAQNRPSFNQAITGGPSTVVSTDSIDLLTANRNIGRSGPIRAHSVVTTALAGGTSIQVQLITSANANLSSPTVIATGAVVPLASATAGAELFDQAVPGTAQRYIGFQYVLLGTFTGAGAVSSHLVAETDNQPYPTMQTGL